MKTPDQQIIHECPSCGCGVPAFLDEVDRQVLDALANAYWLQSRMYLDALRIGANKPPHTNEEQWDFIQNDPFWRKACAALEPGYRAGLTTSLTVCKGINPEHPDP